MSTSFHITTFGCQMNRHDSDVLAGDLVRRGFVPAADQRDADLIVFNTCAVRAHAEDRLYSRLGALRRLCDHNPSLRIGVIGCVAQKDGLGLLKRFPHVAFVLGTQHLARLGDIAEQILRRPHPAPPTSCVDMPPETLPLPIPSRRAVLRNPWSAQVAVMRGCNNFC
ncbi:MAG: tRNA (N6-isopentenyl adenosine(37)-C2)-methylthiotransferase MiaB, partial [Planctomycetes bacterium]|nr:tRNA (N6-isopentenyl adenosine(37)-C2)-methylthiotransferase MiaB [Planctomycetota bacterium]